jgi:hypothetical protein
MQAPHSLISQWFFLPSVLVVVTGKDGKFGCVMIGGFERLVDAS